MSIESIPRNPSATDILLFAESSRVLSNHCVAAVNEGFKTSIITYLESEVILSHLIGFLLYAIADEPICVFSNGSSISLNDWSILISFENLLADCARPLSVAIICESIFLEYVWPETGTQPLKPIFLAILFSSSLTLSVSPLKSSINEACVPVVPFEPRSLRLSILYSISSRSIRNSFIHKVARLPTVVSCAGWRCVYPSVGRSLYSFANFARFARTLISFLLTTWSASRIIIISVLSPT